MGDARHQRGKTAPLLRLGCRQRKRTHGASVKCAIESNDSLPLGVITRQFQRAFHRLGSRVPEVELVWTRHRCYPAEPLRKLGHGFVVKICAGHVDEFACLSLDGCDHFRVAVSCRSNSDSGGEIEELVAIDVFDNRAIPTFNYEGIRTRVTG